MPSNENLIVSGRVVRVDGTIPSDVEARVFDVDLRNEQTLGVARVSPSDGSYGLNYNRGQFARAEKGSADLKVYVYASKSPSTPLAVSEIHFNADEQEVIDVVIGGTVVLGASEFWRLVTAITPLLEGAQLAIADLVEDEKNKDISFLVGETGETEENISFLVLAHLFSRQSNVAADAFYALLRQNLTPDLKALAGETTESLRKALRASMDRNIIDKKDEKALAAILADLKSLGARLVTNPSNNVDKSPLGSLLDGLLPKPAAFVDELAKFDGDPGVFWKGVRANPDLKDNFKSLQFNTQLAIVTLTHVPLVRELTRQQTAGLLEDFSDLTKFTQSDWLRLVRKPEIGVPSAVVGETAEARATSYATAMTNLIEDSFPAKFFSRRLGDSNDDEAYGSLVGKTDILSFFQRNPAFDLKSTRVADFVAANPGALHGFENPESLKLQLSSVQRVYQVAPRYGHARTLLAEGVTSAMQISRMGRTMFLNSFGSKFGVSNAITIFERSRQNYTMAINLWTNYGSKFRLPLLPSFPRWTDLAPVQKAIPDWETLFGSADSCSCDTCSSITGPAAYFVDILNFLKDRLLIDNSKTTRDGDGNITSVVWLQWTNPKRVKTVKNVKDVLFERRPDLGAIQLTCENTMTPVPFIDLTLEILENYIGPPPSFTPFELAVEAVEALDRQDLKTLAPLFLPHISTPLSEFSIVNVLSLGHSWTIDEPAYTYFITNDDGTINVSSRGRQTRGQATDLAANPQYINAPAYDLLAKEVYPLNLPFDLWTETVRTYLAHVDVKRHQILEIFSTTERAQVISRDSVVQEHLRLTTAETHIILGVKDTSGTPFTDYWKLFGFAKEELDGGSSIANPSDKFDTISTGDWFSVLTGRVDVFLQQVGITYRELLNCVEIGDVLDAELTLDIKAVKGALVDTCDLSKLQLVDASDSSLFKLIRLVRLQQKLEGWSLLDIRRVISSSSLLSDPPSFRRVLLEISCVNRITNSLGLSIGEVQAFWRPLGTVAYRDHVSDEDDKPVPGSQYERVFRNKTINTRRDQSLPKDPSKLSGSLLENSPIITASLNISAADLALLLKDSNIIPDDKLNLENLSRLFRHITLLKALDIASRDYLLILQLVAVDPFENPPRTVDFIERVSKLGASPFTLAQVDYLLRHRIRPDEDVRIADDNVALALEDIRGTLQQIATDQTYSDDIVDPKGDITKKKLALLNWDAKIIAQAIGIISNSSSYQTALTEPLPANLVIPAGFQDALTYDENALTLSFSRIMTTSERTTLIALPNSTDDFKKAVDRLFSSPGTFLKRNMVTYSVPVFSVDLAAIPDGVKIPALLAKKVYWDRATLKLYSVGALTDADSQALIAGVTDTVYTKAVGDLYGKALNQTILPGDGFLDPSDIDFLLDTTSNPDIPQRFLRVLKKLIPQLLETLSNQAVKQKLSQALGISNQILDLLLSKYLHVSGNPISTVFRDVAYSASNKLITITPTRFTAQFQAFRILEKIGLVISGFKIGLVELKWIFEYREQSNGWLSLETLPVDPTLASASFPAWERLIAVFQLRDSISKGKVLLDYIWTAARSSGTTEDDFLEQVAKMASWDLEALKSLKGATALNLEFPKSYLDEIAIAKLFSAIRLTKKIGCSVADALSLAGEVVTEKEARLSRQAVKSKYDQDTWNTVARPLQNILREKQRSALVSYILTHPDRNQRKTWRTPSDVYAFFLVDVEQGPCAFSSRIKQAIGSVQTFVQRCLLNLELEVEANNEVDDGWDEWNSYLKSILLTAANREIYCYPENYLESPFRDDKTPFFKDLENQLLQNAVTKETAELAIMSYIDNLDIVSHLHILTYYHQKEGVQGAGTVVDILHVFARTRSVPWRYFYAKRLDSSTWTPWEKLNVDVQGEHLIPIVWNRRLHLFWGIFTNRQDSQDSILVPKPGDSIPASPTFVDVSLGWSELRVGNWTPKQITDKVVVLSKSGASPEITADFNNWYTFRTSIDQDDNSLTISCIHSTHYPAKQGKFVFRDLKGVVRVVSSWGYVPWVAVPSSLFGLGSSLQQLSNIIPLINPQITMPRGTREYAMTFKGTEKAVFFAPDLNAIQNNPGDEFTLVYSPQRFNPSTDSPFFYQHDQKTFFVETRRRSIFSFPDRVLPYTDKIHPGLMEGGMIDRYLIEPPVPIIRKDLPRPADAGFSKFFQSGPYAGNLLPNLQGDTFAKLPSLFGATTTLAPSLSLSPGSARTILKPSLWKFTGDIYKGIDGSDMMIPVDSVRLTTLPYYELSTLYHPYVTDFIYALNRDGLDGLYQRPLQLSSRRNFASTYNPMPQYFNTSDYPVENVDFLGDSMHSLYNWELFCHIPMAIAGQLSANQQFREAQKWYHYIFDPTDTSSLDSPNRFWQMGHFYLTSKKTYADETLPNILLYLAKGGAGVTLTAEESKIVKKLETDVDRWRKNPFNPFLVARARTTAFQKWIVMKYLDNLIAWGDQLFRQDSIETINEATQLYVLAAEILGDRPEQIPRRAIPKVQTFDSIADSLDEIGNSLAQIETMVSAANTREATDVRISAGSQHQVAAPSMLYFCVPNNPKLVAYWDTVADRLFKIRNCMNLQGIVRELALFEPPLDPAALVRAAASGVDVSSAMNDMNVALSQYRYPTLSAKAIELVAQVKEFGRSFLEALEKKDANAMSRLQTENEIDLLDRVTAVKEAAVTETKHAFAAIEKGLDVVKARRDYFKDRDLMNTKEEIHMGLELASTILDLLESGSQPVSAVLHLIPDAKLGAPTSIGITFGGPAVARSASKFGEFMGKLGGLVKHASSMVGQMGSFDQRKEDWDHQANLATKEIAQINVQLDGANVRYESAKKELNNHKRQLENTKKVNDLMHSKFTGTELYDWMISQIASAYFQSYQLAYDAAKLAERAFIQEVGADSANFVRFGTWDSLKKGLLAGDHLHQDLLRLGSAYIEQNKREYEITQNICLAQIDPLALIQLRTAGECTFRFSEAVFDTSYPGHYMRRLKTVGITIPTVVGPYTPVSATLSLLRSSTRINALAKDRYTRRDNDIRFRDNFEQFDSICTSTGIADHGLFELNLRDERKLPFEYAGAISTWRLTLPNKFRQFDYDTISDVIFQVRYTARDGGEALRDIVERELQQRILDAVQMAEGQTGMGRLFQLRRDFPDDFYRLTRSAEGSPQEMSLKLDLRHLPYMFVAAKSVLANKAAVFVKVRDEFKTDVTGEKLRVSLRNKGADRGDGVQLVEWNGVLRGSVALGGRKWGELTLTVWEDGEERVPGDALEDVLLVVYYSATWP